MVKLTLVMKDVDVGAIEAMVEEWYGQDFPAFWEDSESLNWEAAAEYAVTCGLWVEGFMDFGILKLESFVLFVETIRIKIG